MSNKSKLYYFYGNSGTIFFVRHNTQTAYVHENDGDFRPEFTNPVLALLDAEMERIKKFSELGDNVKQELYEMECTSEEDYE